jgi:glycosyltransferase involved in cell wall biosynthesis
MSKNNVLIDLVVVNAAILPATEQTYKGVCNQVYFGKQGRSYFRLLWLLVVLTRLTLRKYDALYTNGQGESIKLLGIILRKKGPWVHHHHTSGDVDDRKTWGSNYLEVLKKCETVIACSSRNAKEMATYLKRRVETIPCFSRKITIVNHRGEREGKVKFGYYGRLIPEKGIDLLCEMSEDSELQNIEFHIWGTGEAYPAAFFTRYSNLRYNGTFSGEAGLAATISSLDAFLLLSTHPEGLPISLLEAMSAGLPWLATDRGGVRDIACDAMCTRVIEPASDYNTIKRAVKSLAEDIISGKVSKEAQENLYNKKYSYNALIPRWSTTLGLNAN